MIPGSEDITKFQPDEEKKDLAVKRRVLPEKVLDYLQQHQEITGQDFARLQGDDNPLYLNSYLSYLASLVMRLRQQGKPICTVQGKGYLLWPEAKEGDRLLLPSREKWIETEVAQQEWQEKASQVFARTIVEKKGVLRADSVFNPQQLQVLSLLFQMGGEVVEFKDFQGEVWDPEMTLTTKVVDRLRPVVTGINKKLNPELGLKVESVRGQGYRLVMESAAKK